MTRWEYLFLEMPVNKGTFLPDDYGNKGWELVAVLPASPEIDRMWFKRPKPVNVKRPPATPPEPIGSARSGGDPHGR